ncbi:hypothetical protein [Novipirellula galeiformis]|uniref:hypothetical protein n=1 Tax=Novipirellula galeiformis TaxID=2528004 RepID=UPI0018CD4B90|nr:hypothetical protein [Novipirellula galeiformis]
MSPRRIAYQPNPAASTLVHLGVCVIVPDYDEFAATAIQSSVRPKLTIAKR